MLHRLTRRRVRICLQQYVWLFDDGTIPRATHKHYLLPKKRVGTRLDWTTVGRVVDQPKNTKLYTRRKLVSRYKIWPKVHRPSSCFICRRQIQRYDIRCPCQCLSQSLAPQNLAILAKADEERLVTSKIEIYLFSVFIYHSTLHKWSTFGLASHSI